MHRPAKVEFLFTSQEHGAQDRRMPTYTRLHYDADFFFQSARKLLLRASQTREKFKNIKYSEGSSPNPWNRILLQMSTVALLLTQTLPFIERLGFQERSHQCH
jgi:hypothetical protein